MNCARRGVKASRLAPQTLLGRRFDSGAHAR
jgi:hypothetical protein